MIRAMAGTGLQRHRQVMRRRRLLTVVAAGVAGLVAFLLLVPLGCVTSDCPWGGRCSPGSCITAVGFHLPGKTLTPAILAAILVFVLAIIVAEAGGRFFARRVRSGEKRG